MEALFYRDEFLSIASHELKTPLTSIKLQTQVFKRNTTKDALKAYSKENVDRMIHQIEMQTNRMMKLIEDMLDISRIRSGQLTITKSHFNLTELVWDISQQHPDAELLRFNLEEEINFVGDQDRIAQVLMILLNNAARYGKGLPVDVALFQKKSKIFLTVTDQGEGIAQEDQRRIFHRFQRAIPASQVSGLGLGLYIAREIIEAHKGKISVKSEPDKGSIFTIEFKREELQ